MATPNETWVLPPPADRITPAVARCWLHRSYPPLSRLASMAVFPEVAMRGIGLRMREREPALSGLRVIGNDIRRITEACGKALATGRAVTMELDLDTFIDRRNVARSLRAVLKYERRGPLLALVAEVRRLRDLLQARRAILPRGP